MNGKAFFTSCIYLKVHLHKNESQLAQPSSKIDKLFAILEENLAGPYFRL
jgi:hypothetical protein